MSTSSRLDPSEVSLLREASFDGLRVQVDLPDDVDPRMVLTGEARRFTPVARVLQEGPAGDLIGTYWGIIYLISDRFHRYLRDQDVSGWQAQPLSIPQGPESISVWLLSVTGRCGPVFGAGGVQGESIPSIGQYLDPMRWDGSEMFVPDNLSAIYLTQECAKKLRSGGLRNLDIEPAGLESLPA